VRRVLPLLLWSAACAPSLGSPEWLVDRPRLLAVRAEPPEVRPGERAIFRVLVASADGELDASAVVWSVCTAPLPLTESGAVSSACLGTLPASGRGDAASIATSPDACGRFGPIASPDVQRAREPDATGGYYQPIRVQYGEESAFALQRLRCPLAQASLQVAQDFDRRYLVNSNPAISSFTASRPLEGIPAGASVDLSLAWDAGSLERFPVLDPASLSLVDQQESMAVSWYATAGALDVARTGSTGTETANRWTAPRQAGRVYLWAVLRDSRGGIAWAATSAIVVPEGP
jgi:hypothetical protein